MSVKVNRIGNVFEIHSDSKKLGKEAGIELGR